MRIPHGLRAALASQGAAPAPSSDANFENVSLLLHGDGTNGAQNNTFTDGSTNNFTITRNGNTTQGTFSPFSPTGWSAYFDGTGDYLSWSGTTLSGDFTVECWVYKTATDASGYTNVFSSSSQNTQLAFDSTNAGSMSLVINVSVVIGASGTAVTPNTWNHLAWVREGSTCRAYVNGVQVGTGTSSASMNLSFIGQYYEGGYEMNGYISNARITNACLYPGGTTFTPSTSPLTTTVSSGTVQLLTLQDNRFKDNSTNNFTITRNGDTKIEAFSPFNPTAAYSASTHGGSGYFQDAVADYLTTPSSAQFNMGTGDWTVEGWFYTNKANQEINVTWHVGAINASDGMSGGVARDAVTFRSNGTVTITGAVSIGNQWAHVAWVKVGSSNTVTVYVNGVSAVSGTFSNSIATGAFTCGFNNTSFRYGGYISNLRVLKGTAQYTSNFTPPTAPLTAITNTSLLLNFTNGGIIDNASKNVLETVGNAQISTSVKKFGTGSMYFDGTGDYLYKPSDNMTSLGGDFTVEAWIYRAVSGVIHPIINVGDYLNSTGIVFYVSSGNALAIYTNNALAMSGGTISTTTWTHVAMVRSGTGSGNIKLYVDGVSVGTPATNTATFSGRLQTGADFYNSTITSYFNGYIDDLRITRGVARYTANFTPPTAAFPDL